MNMQDIAAALQDSSKDVEVTLTAEDMQDEGLLGKWGDAWFMKQKNLGGFFVL